MCYNININADGLKRESDCIMKKVALLILCFTILICLVACNNQQPENPTPEHTHSFGEWEITKNPTCTEDGIKARFCDCGEQQNVGIPSEGHTKVVLEATSPTCTTEGKTEGEKCSDCGEILLAQEKIDALGHNEITDTGVDATCTQNGLTEGKHCSVCNEILVAQTVIDAKGHTEVIDASVSATCTSTGLTEGKHCSDCSIIILEQKTIAASGHFLVNGNCENCDYIYRSEGLEYTSNGDGNCYVSGIGSCKDTDIVIPETSPNNERVVAIGEDAFYRCSNLNSVVIPDCVTTIGERAFYDCDSLSSVVIGDSVTTIGDDAFSYCSNLTDVYISDVAKWCTIKFVNHSSNPLYYASNLYVNNVLATELVIPDGVTAIGNYAFYDCNKLSSVVIPDSVTTIGNYAFAYCPLSSVVIPDSVTTIGNSAFSSCSSLNSVVIGDSVTAIGNSAFYGCSSLSSVVIPDSVITIGNCAFYYCGGLTSVVIPDSVTTIGYKAFYNCYNLSSVVIGDSVTTIGDWAFRYCDNLKNVYYTGSETEWQAITIGSDNTKLTNATKHYNYVPGNN